MCIYLYKHHLAWIKHLYFLSHSIVPTPTLVTKKPVRLSYTTVVLSRSSLMGEPSEATHRSLVVTHFHSFVEPSWRGFCQGCQTRVSVVTLRWQVSIYLTWPLKDRTLAISMDGSGGFGFDLFSVLPNPPLRPLFRRVRCNLWSFPGKSQRNSGKPRPVKKQSSIESVESKQYSCRWAQWVSVLSNIIS